MAYGQDLVREWLFEYACRHYMPAVLHEIALHHSSIWTEELWSIPPIFPMMAVVRDVVASKDEEKYSYVLDIVVELYERTANFVEYSIYAKLSVALKILVLFRMLRNSDKMVLPRLNAYFPRSGFHNPNADKNTEKHLNHGQLEFRKFFLRLIANESARKLYMETEFDNEYGERFTLRLKELVRRFLNAIETTLPQPVIDMILASPPDSALVQELVSSHSPSVEVLLDAAEGHDHLTELQVLEVLQTLRMGNSSVQSEISLVMSSTGQESTSVLRNGDLSKMGMTSNKSRRRKALEDKDGPNNCPLKNGVRGHASNFVPPRKKTRVSNGCNDFVEEDESSSASEVQKDRVAGLRNAACPGTNSIESLDNNENRCSKSTGCQNDSQENGEIDCSKSVLNENSRDLNRGEKSPNCKHCCVEGDTNFSTSNSMNCCHTRPSSSDALSSSFHGPATLQCPVMVERHSQPSVSASVIQDQANGADCKQNSACCSVRGKEDALVDEDLEPTEELRGDSSHDCSPLSLESGKEQHTGSPESPMREDAIPDTPPCKQGISSSHRATSEEFREEEVVDDRSYVTDSEDLQSRSITREEIVPSSYSFDKFDLVVRDVLPTVSLPRLQKYVHSSLRLCVIKLHENPEYDYTAINGKKMMIFH